MTLTFALALAAALSVGVGVALGMMGGGGAILTVPILVYVLGLEPKPAMASSAVVVGATALLGLALHARGGRVRWKTGAVFGAGGIAGAYTGARVAGFVPGSALLVFFAVLMIVTSVAMIRKRPADPGPVAAAAIDSQRLPAAWLALLGAVTGLVTGLVGAGGGFLIVPALVLVARVPMRDAVGTSLFIIVGNSAATIAGYLGHVSFEWKVTGVVASCALAGALVGTRFAERVSQRALRVGFGLFVLAMGTLILGQRVASLAVGGGLGALLDRLLALAAAPSLGFTLAVSAAVGVALGLLGFSMGRRSARRASFPRQ